ncbi:MAG: fructosamine kinase family protein [Anaerolineales bacterium]|nr:fructosamine kinase family protein [Anaerolineales bacterium]
MIPDVVSEWCQKNGYGEVVSRSSVGGGCINNGVRLKTASGITFFLKTNQSAPADMFVREAEGLDVLCVPGGPRVPKPYLYGSDFLLLEDLAPSSRTANYWSTFGRQLASLHNYTNPNFGFAHDNYIGSTPQPNSWRDDGYTFFSEHRLLFQAELARKRGLLGITEARQVDNICNRLVDLIPEQPPSLIHGDLWSGNAMTDIAGEPAIIDPAAHYGWAEADLAMTTLFGSFPEVFYRAYREVRTLEDGFRERFHIYNLYHLLNHLNLFGTAYLGQVLSILTRTRIFLEPSSR